MKGVRIDFNDIRPHKGTKSGGFEELAVQLAWLEPRHAEDAFNRKGPGADAGVECFVQHGDGSETAWQAKYFFTFGDAQTGQLDESIEQALTKHPRLKKYIVAMPIDLRDGRVGKQQSELARWNAWTKKWTKGRKLKIERWGAFEMNERLGRDSPHYSGRMRFWFDQTRLSPEWFRQRFDASRAGLGERYTPELNIELPIRQGLLAFFRDPSSISRLQDWRDKVDELGHRARRAFERGFDEALTATPNAALHSVLRNLGRVFSGVAVLPSEPVPVAQIASLVAAAIIATSACIEAAWSAVPSRNGGDDKQRYALHALHSLEDALRQIADELGRAERWTTINARRLLVHGEAGVGKSHLLADAAEHHVERGRPALVILGGTLVENDVWSQIINAIGLQGLTTDEFLGALDAAGQASGARAVIIVDAINERHGIHIWPSRLASFLRTIEAFPHVAVVVSCRSIYMPFIVPDDLPPDDLSRLEHAGFAGHPEAARYYLDRRGIVRMAAPNLVPEFENPLFLKTCCDFLLREGRRELPRGLRGVTAIFEFYSDAVARAIERRMALDPRQRVVARALAALASACDGEDRGHVDLDEAIRVLEAIHPSNASIDRSLLTQLESEGVIAVEPVQDEHGTIRETVRFSFERYSDHRIASRLLDRHLLADDPVGSFAKGTTLHEYVTGESSYDRAGVIEALAIQVAERTGHELPDLVGDGPYRWLVQEAFRKSVLWREQRCFTRRTLDLSRAYAPIPKEDHICDLLVAIATEPDNAFNADFLDETLRGLSMPERDHLWSIFVAQTGEEEDSHVGTLIAWTLQNGMEEMEGRRAELAAVALCWLFTTSNRHIRDHATKALAALLAKRLPLAALLLARFAQVDDLYVLERLLAASYGAALQGLQDEALGALAKSALDVVFGANGTVTHVLIRDHARGIVELAKVRRKLPKGISIARARPPYGSSNWRPEDVPDELIATYTEQYRGHTFHDEIVSSTINDGDFARYIIDHTADHWSDLPIEFVGEDRRSIYLGWRRAFQERHRRAANRLVALEEAGDALRAHAAKRPKHSLYFASVLRAAEKTSELTEPAPDEIELADKERVFDAAERALLKLMDSDEKLAYESRARSHLHRGFDWRKYRYSWPSRIDTRAMRRWVCRRAHELGWSSKLFSDFDRHLGSGGRMEHRVERFGKKYQWLALHELLARLGDNFAYAGSFGQRDLEVFQGPWQMRGRDMDPSLLAVTTHEDGWRQWDSTWWMPVSVSLGPMSARARVAWLDQPDDVLNGPHLIDVTQPRTGRSWLVLQSFGSWRQWVVQDGDRHMVRDTSTNVRCLLFHRNDLESAIKALSKQLLFTYDVPSIEWPSRGYLGEYPWHPAYGQVDPWVDLTESGRTKVPAQPTVVNYLAERSGHDYSIDDTFNFNLPSPGLIEGMKLHLSDGSKLSYAGEDGRVLFYDPTTVEPGPQAALVDKQAFLAFLKRRRLAALWIISGQKNVYGARSYEGGFGGSRSFTSLYWASGDGYERQDHAECEDPSPDQLAKLWESEGS